jgi:hypothetical protein
VAKSGRAVGSHESDLVLQGARERASLVSKEQRLEQRDRQATAVDRHEPACPSRMRVDGTGQHFLSRAGLAEEKDGKLGPSYAL